MEKKFEPTPEMKAKIEEMKGKGKAREVQELSAEDLDKVSGGCCLVDGEYYVYIDDPAWGTMTVDEFYDLVKWAYDAYDFGMALDLALDIFPSLFIKETLESGGPEFMRDTLKSRIYNYYYGDHSLLDPYSIWG